MGDTGTASRQLLRAAKPQTTWRLVLVFPGDVVRETELPVGKAVTVGRTDANTVKVDVPSVSRAHCTLTASAKGVSIEDPGSRHGTFLDGARVTTGLARDGSVLRLGDVVAVIEESPPRASSTNAALDFVPGYSAGASEVRQLVLSAAADKAPVLVSGETGVGKEWVAKGIHALSGRKGALVSVNCAALPSELVESQLFGHVKGAFTGADTVAQGFFRAANGGTLFLDELGELSLDVQAKLLRAIQEQEVVPVGATTPTRIDVRFIGATNRDLREMVEAQTFRRDLYARLAFWDIAVAPMRERRVDIVMFLERFARQWTPGLRELPLTPEALETILLDPLRENLRALDRLGHLLSKRKTPMAPVELPAWLGQTAVREALPLQSPPPPPESAEELVAALERHGSIRATAKHFQKDRKQVYRWIQQFGVSWGDPE
jgi:transcriptional regulator with GAF, ATPase, and Fis domain